MRKTVLLLLMTASIAVVVAVFSDSKRTEYVNAHDRIRESLGG